MDLDLTVAGYLINKNKMLLIKHKKLKLWLPVGGHMEENETLDDALKREFKEEVGLKVNILNKVIISKKGNILEQLALPFFADIHNVGDHNHYCQFFICEALGEINIKKNEKEILDYDWFNKSDLYKKQISPDVKNIGLLAFKKYKTIKNAMD